MDGEQRSDAEIECVVQRALKWAVDENDPQISFAVANGQVTLEGRVAVWAQRAHIERAVRVLGDVSCLFNRIQVSAAPAVCESVNDTTGSLYSALHVDERATAEGKKSSGSGASAGPVFADSWWLVSVGECQASRVR